MRKRCQEPFLAEVVADAETVPDTFSAPNATTPLAGVERCSAGRRSRLCVPVRRDGADEAHRKHHPARASRAVIKSRRERVPIWSGTRLHGGKLRGGQRRRVCTLGLGPPSASARGECGSAALRTTARGLRSRLRCAAGAGLPSGRNYGHAKAQNAAAEQRHDPRAVRRPAAPGDDAPTAAA